MITFASLTAAFIAELFLLALVVAVIFLAILFGRFLYAVASRLVHFVFGVVADKIRLVGGLIVAVSMLPLVLLSVMAGRWSYAEHYGGGLRRGLRLVGASLYSVFVRRPLRLFALDRALADPDPIAVDKVGRQSRSRGGVSFRGYDIVGTLPAGGSGARLYIAVPDDRTRAKFDGFPDRVAIKSFDLVDGSTLPQVVRESRALDAARSLGLVLDHELEESRFWYAMPFHDGDHLGVVVRSLHDAGSGDGLVGSGLEEAMGFEIDLLRTLNRYHDQGLWHKDVKPENIIVHGGHAHLVDFGLVSSLRSAMTLTTHGTEYFRDPEMVRMAMRGVKVHEVEGRKFDVYGAGAVLYYMLENTFPGHGGLSRFGRNSPEALRWIVRRAMTDYDRRYATATEMLQDLEFVAAQPDVWAVAPASLPSVRSGEASVADTPPPAEEAVVRSSRDVVRPAGRPRLVVSNWWTGSYRRANATDGVTGITGAAPRRAADRRPGLGSVILGLLLLLGLAAIVAGGMAWNQSRWRTTVALPTGDEGPTWIWSTASDTWVDSGPDLALEHAPEGAEAPSDGSSGLVFVDDVDDAPESLDAFLDRLESTVIELGWTPIETPAARIEAGSFAVLQTELGGQIRRPTFDRMVDRLHERGIGAVVVVEEDDGLANLSARLVRTDGTDVLRWRSVVIDR